MKTLFSIFDRSGRWSQPYFENGWNVINWDIGLDEFMDINLIDSVQTCLEICDDCDGILFAPPCTDFTVSGAQYWKAKDKDGRTQKSLELVRQCQRIVNLYEPTDPTYYQDGYSFFWSLENPVGRLGKLSGMGQPLMYFDPWEYAGWNNVTPAEIKRLDRIRSKNGFHVTEAENNLVLRTECYTKKTGLWGKFNTSLEKWPIERVKTAPQGSPSQRLGGKSDKTKELRSNTPMGFAWAFYHANH